MGRSWRNFFRRSKKEEEPSEVAVEAPEQEPAEVVEPEDSTNGLAETSEVVEEPPIAEAPDGDSEAPVHEVTVRGTEDEEDFAPEPEIVEPEPIEAREADVVEATLVEGGPEDEEPEEPRGWFGRRRRRGIEDEETVSSPEPAGPVQAREAGVMEAAPVEDVPDDEEMEESRGWFGRLRNGLSRSRESFVGQLNAAVAEFKDADDEEFWERVEEILITSDVGVPTTAKLVAELEQEALEKNITSGKELREIMIEHAARILDKPVELDISHKPTVVLMVGVNGTGKTTNIGKLVHFLPGNVMLAAGDTFRAAAIEQLQMWGERTGAKVVARERGSDSASVAHDAVEAAKSDGADVLLIDTAGRLHTKVNLMAELDKVKRVIERQLPGAPHEVLLTVDATTGQNGLRQAKLFHEVAGVTGIILTKLDGTAKGGIALAIANEVGVPIKMISVGEQIGDLHPFEAREFAQALFGDL
ncbi:MAG: signal recognition particle-docking protein FtsY [Actinobacteria bacterium]|jgi:fused signal recognition particle receptor|nr:signal recognition particle-docking protein FtsY [Actinomycetota bacterium]PLS85542.1 MAG: signal recognition particle-docking protein FtsY [Actinomycetota bacterium]